jgi:hypothetical protein
MSSELQMFDLATGKHVNSMRQRSKKTDLRYNAQYEDAPIEPASHNRSQPVFMAWILGVFVGMCANLRGFNNLQDVCIGWRRYRYN